jgi:hypothetical protein
LCKQKITIESQLTGDASVASGEMLNDNVRLYRLLDACPSYVRSGIAIEKFHTKPFSACYTRRAAPTPGGFAAKGFNQRHCRFACREMNPLRRNAIRSLPFKSWLPVQMEVALAVSGTAKSDALDWHDEA